MARKKKPPEHVNHERWLVSYADFITLLFAFFTTLYAISTVDAKKMGKMVMSMQASFDTTLFPAGGDKLTLLEGSAGAGEGNMELVERISSSQGVDEEGTDKTDKEDALESLLGMDLTVVPSKDSDPKLSDLLRVVDSVLDEAVDAGVVRTRIERRGLVLSLGEEGFFDSGSEKLKPQGRTLLDSIANSISSTRNPVRIEGHTDNIPIRSGRFPSNWELSTARSSSVVSYLIEHYGFRPDRLSAAGYGEFRPVASNETAEGRARNRRVDIVIMNAAESSREPH